MNGTRWEFHPPYASDVDVIAKYDSGRVLIVRPTETGGGARYFDVWVGPDDNRELMGGTNTEHMARAYARQFTNK